MKTAHRFSRAAARIQTLIDDGRAGAAEAIEALTIPIPQEIP